MRKRTLSCHAGGVLGVVVALGMLMSSCSLGGDRADVEGPAGADACAELGREATLTFRASVSDTPLGPTGSERRRAHIRLPSGRPSDGTIPVVLGLHGLSQPALRFASRSGLEAVARSQGYASVFPEGFGNPVEWHFDGSDGETQDLAFIEQLLRQIASLDCVDSDRIFVVGYSSGGGMASTLACRLSSEIDGAVLVSARHQVEPCAPDRAVPILSLHAADDRVLPYAGGRIEGIFTFPKVLSVERVMRTWAAHNGCGMQPRVRRARRGTAVFRWHDCVAPVVHLKLPSGGHAWPRRDRGSAVSAQSIALEFLEESST